MNKVFLLGRLTKDIELREGNGKYFTRFTLAVDRRGEGTDFLNCVAFGKTAEWASKYLSKGSKALVEGKLQSSSYEKDGKKSYSYDVIVDSMEFADSKKKAETPEDHQGGWITPEGEDLPFK